MNKLYVVEFKHMKTETEGSYLVCYVPYNQNNRVIQVQTGFSYNSGKFCTYPGHSRPLSRLLGLSSLFCLQSISNYREVACEINMLTVRQQKSLFD